MIAEDQQQNTTDENNQSCIMSYVSFDQLLQPQQELNLIGQNCTDLFKSGDWKQQFSGIDLLRQVNKYQHQQFCQIFIPTFCDDICLLVDNLRSNLTKNCLMLVKEIFQLCFFESISGQALKKFVKKVFEKSIYDKSFIKTEAKEAIHYLEQNKTSSYNSMILEQLCELCFDKNANIQEMACSSLVQILKANEENLQNMDPNVMKTIVSTLAKNLQGKRAVLKRLSQELCCFLNEKIGQNAFNNLDNHEKNLVQITLEKSNNNLKQQQNIKDFIKQKREKQTN